MTNPFKSDENYPDNLPNVWADKIRVRQILLNLLSNGIKYTETGSVTLTAEVREDKIYLAVTDTGPGIPAEALNSIFDRFEQIQNRIEIQGTGLGLDISQRLVQLHGSQIIIDSTVGIGSTFAFMLPITDLPVNADEQAQRTNDNIDIFQETPYSHLMVLVIAQDGLTRQTLRGALEQEGIVVIEVTDNEQAYELAAGLLPDLVLIDTDLPTQDLTGLIVRLQDNVDTQEIPNRIDRIVNQGFSTDIECHKSNRY